MSIVAKLSPISATAEHLLVIVLKERRLRWLGHLHLSTISRKATYWTSEGRQRADLIKIDNQILWWILEKADLYGRTSVKVSRARWRSCVAQRAYLHLERLRSKVSRIATYLFVYFCLVIACFSYYFSQLLTTTWVKKAATLPMAITLSILGGFAKFFHCCID